jgi:hypothetical protein
MRVPGLPSVVDARGGGCGNGRACTPRVWWRIVLEGRCYAVAPKVSSGVWGIAVRTRCASGSGWALRCGVIGRGVRGTAQVVNDSGSAVLAANVEMICLGSPAFCALRVFPPRDRSMRRRPGCQPRQTAIVVPDELGELRAAPVLVSWSATTSAIVAAPAGPASSRRCLCRHVRSSRRSERPPCPRPDTA